VPVTQALAIAAILTLGAMIDYGLFNGVGKPGRWLAYAAVTDLLTLAMTAALAPRGLLAVAAGFIGVALIATTVRWVLVGRLLVCTPQRVAGVFGRAMVAVAGSAAAGLSVRSATSDAPALVSLGFIAAAVLFVHVALVRLVSPLVLTDIRDTLPLPRRLSRWFRT
jgi:hypothetical protein